MGGKVGRREVGVGGRDGGRVGWDGKMEQGVGGLEGWRVG